MAQSLTAIIPKILANGLMALREQAITVRLVNNMGSSIAGRKGSTVDVPVPSAVGVADVTPALTHPAGTDLAPTTVPVTLDKWKEAAFAVTDKELAEVEANSLLLPMEASEAIKALANQVDTDVLNNYKGIYGFQGTPGTTPFGSNISDATGLRKVLNQQLAPNQDRSVLIDPDAEAAALGLREFHDASFSGDFDAIREGRLNRRLGFDWYYNQNVLTHTCGTLSGTTGARKALINDASVTVGQTSIDLDDTSLTGTIVEGDVFTVAGDTQTYVCTGTKTAAGNAITGLTFSPAAKVAWADNAELEIKNTHVVNLGMQRFAIAFASRPLDPGPNVNGTMIDSMVDPISGITLRLEISRLYKQTRWSFDILYGSKLVRPELAARLAG